MGLSILPMLVEAETKYIKDPDIEEVEETFYPGEKSLIAVWDGAYGYLSSGRVTLGLVPVIAGILYRMGVRIAGVRFEISEEGVKHCREVTFYV